MTLNQINIMGRPVGGFIDFAHGAHLAFTVRCQEIAAHVIGKTYAVDQSIYMILIAYGVGQTFENQNSGAFSNNQAVGIPVEGGTTPGG